MSQHKICPTKFHHCRINTKLKKLSRRQQKEWNKAKQSNQKKTGKKKKILIKKDTRPEGKKAYKRYVIKKFPDDSTKCLWKVIRNRKRDNVGYSPLCKETSLTPDALAIIVPRRSHTRSRRRKGKAKCGNGYKWPTKVCPRPYTLPGRHWWPSTKHQNSTCLPTTAYCTKPSKPLPTMST